MKSFKQEKNQSYHSKRTNLILGVIIISSRSLKNNFIEVKLTCSNLQIFEVHSLKSSDTFLHPWNHHPNEDNDLLITLQSSSCPMVIPPSCLPLVRRPLLPTPSLFPRQLVICFLSLYIKFSDPWVQYISPFIVFNYI